MSQARLIPVRTPKTPEGVVLVLHGGAARRDRSMVSPTQLSVLRMIPIAKRVAKAGQGRLAVHRLLNTSRGWDASHTPVDDVRWAIEQVRAEHGELPVSLVGHSLGGRAALLSARRPEVRSVVALNPWVYPAEDVGDVSGTEVLFVHGTGDRIADPRRAQALAQAMRRRTRVGFVAVQDGKHAMLRRSGVFTSLAADFARDTLLGRESSGVLGQARGQGDAATVV